MTIRDWLVQQENDGVEGSFLGNWESTLEAHHAGKMLVYVDLVSKEPVAYIWGMLIENGILDVRHDWRGRGIGSSIVKHCIALAYAADNPILFVQCSPRTSIPFWLKMGFSLVSNGIPSTQCAVLRLPKQYLLPDEGERVEVLVEWFPKSLMWMDSAVATRTCRIPGVHWEGMVDLAERVAEYCRVDGEQAVLRVSVNGVLWYIGKAYYRRAEELGVQLTDAGNGYFFSCLYEPEKLPFVPD